jgi:adenylate cyclase
MVRRRLTEQGCMAMEFPHCDDEDLFELRLFIEEIVCNICRFMHVARDGQAPESVRIRQEVQVGPPQAFADIVVEVPGLTRYIVEVDYGYSLERIVESLGRKYRQELDWCRSIAKLILVIDRHNHPDPYHLKERVKSLVPHYWELEIWEEEHFLGLIRDYFGIEMDAFSSDKLQDVRNGIDQAQGRYAFGEAYANSPLDAAFLWHFGYWRLRSLFEAAGRVKRQLLSPGMYRNVAVVFADLSGYSGYVHDTPYDRTIQQCLSFFCSKSRYQIINDGGMVYQFLGDSVIGFFGLPDHSTDYIDRAWDCARSLLMVGESVSNEWQRRLDRVQAVHGSHIGIALGDIQIYSLRPFSRTYIGAVGDAINIAARLSAHAQPGQIVVSNLIHRHLSVAAQRMFQESEPVQAKNVGLIRAWTFDQEAEAVERHRA